MNNILKLKNKEEFREWLEENHSIEKECFLELKRGKPVDDKLFYYLDAVEVALCYGWIDSTLTLIDGKRMQRFSPRSKNSSWTELNKERVRRLEKLGLMRDAGRNVYPDINSFRVNEEIQNEIMKNGLWDIFSSFPILYQRIRLSNLEASKKRSKEEYDKAMENFIKHTKNHEMYGEWNDYGRLINY